MRKRILIADEIQLDGEFIRVDHLDRSPRAFIGRSLPTFDPTMTGWLEYRSGERVEVLFVPKRDVQEVRERAGHFSVVVNDEYDDDRPRKRVPGSAKGLLTVPDDFDDPIEDFSSYL